MRLHRGDYDDVVERAADPVALAAPLGRGRRARVHLVDLDGARSGRVRPDLVRERGRGDRAASRCRPRAASARSATRDALLEAGADRVIVGTAAWPDPTPWVERSGRPSSSRSTSATARVRAAGWTRERRPGRRRGGRPRARRRASSACSAPRSTATERWPAPTSSWSSRRGRGPAVLAAGGVRSPDDVAALAAAGAEAASSAGRCSHASDEREVRLQRRELEAVRRLAGVRGSRATGCSTPRRSSGPRTPTSSP